VDQFTTIIKIQNPNTTEEEKVEAGAEVEKATKILTGIIQIIKLLKKTMI